MILGLCDNPDVLKVMRIIDIVITIIKIAVPILLMISGMIGYMNAVHNNDSDALSKENKLFVRKIIAAILIFLIPTFVKLLADISSNSVEYAECIANANPEGISTAYYNVAKVYIKTAYTSKTRANYNIALSYINSIKDEDLKNELLNELELLGKYLDIKEKIEAGKEKYETLLAEIEKIDDEELKSELMKELEKVGLGKPLNVDSSFKKYSDNTYSSLNGYYLYIPKNATENMPLIVVLPPNSLAGANMKSIVETYDLDKLKAFVYIPLIASAGRQDWTTSASTSAVKKIKDLVKEYKLNDKKISLTAFSSSGWYIYWTANEYRIFSAIAPISSGMGIESIKSYKDWEYLKTLPMKGYGEKGGPTTESGRSCASVGTVTWSARSAMCSTFEGLGKCSSCSKCEYFTYLPEVCHGEIGKYVFSIDEDKNGISDIMEWMISQSK